MSVRPYRDILRRDSRQIMVGNVPVGGGAPITVQSMTNTLTHDVAATVALTKSRPRRFRRSLLKQPFPSSRIFIFTIVAELKPQSPARLACA
jgi:hypothetical protein